MTTNCLKSAEASLYGIPEFANHPALVLLAKKATEQGNISAGYLSHQKL